MRRCDELYGLMDAERWSKEELDNFVQDLQPIRSGKVSIRQTRKAARTERPLLRIRKEFREPGAGLNKQKLD